MELATQPPYSARRQITPFAEQVRVVRRRSASARERAMSNPCHCAVRVRVPARVYSTTPDKKNGQYRAVVLILSAVRLVRL
ncbi:MAG: hypothetical protein JO354_13880 [Verrucomicrobia bacterium]|nr:hypothetical protein [Verrucomicrobiota bacterium]